MSKVNTSVVDVTPELAKAILGQNDKNRPISSDTVTKYSKLMKQNKWQFNGETIIIAIDGTLLDGQHRLSAIVASKTVQKMIVVKGVAKDAFTTIDIGKKRNASDALATYSEKYKKYRILIAACATTLQEFDNDVWNGSSTVVRPTHEETIKFVEANQGILKSVEYVSSLSGARKIIPQSALAACHYLFSKKDAFEAARFFEKLNNGERLNAEDPVLVLRQRLIEMRFAGGVFRAREVLPYIIKTWSLVRQGKKSKQLHIKSDYIPQVI